MTLQREQAPADPNKSEKANRGIRAFQSRGRPCGGDQRASSRVRLMAPKSRSALAQSAA